MTDDNGDDWTVLHHDDDVTKTIFKSWQNSSSDAAIEKLNSISEMNNVAMIDS